MKKFRVDGGFLISFVINLLFNLEWVALAFILFLLHKFLKLPMWPVWGALALWVGGVFITTLVLSLLAAWGNSADDTPAQNKNPYSNGADRTNSMVQPEPAAAATSANSQPKTQPVQFKSELARAIMQPQSYSQPETKTDADANADTGGKAD